MTLVRLKDGFYSTESSAPEYMRMTHIIPDSTVELDVAEDGSHASQSEPITSCCGVTFQLGMLEEVAWGTSQPHDLCGESSILPRSFIERLYREMADEAIRSNANEADEAAAIAMMETVLSQRDDWMSQDNAEWLYTASFNEVFPEERMYPRQCDLGLALLQVEIVGADRMHIHTCGVRDGCPQHIQQTETYSLKSIVIDEIKHRISVHETNAMSIDLQRLMWCMFTGACSRTVALNPRR